jgi:signal transduction histidine kinase
VRKLWPQSLTGQIAMLVAAALLVAQAINFGFLYRERQRQLSTQVTAPTIARLVDAIERDASGQQMARQDGPRRIFIEPKSRVTAAMERRDDAIARAHDVLSDLKLRVVAIEAGEAQAKDFPRPDRIAQVRDAMDRRDARPRSFLVVSAQVAPDRWITSVGRFPGREPRFIWTLLIQTLVLYGLVLSAVLFIVRRIARPLGQLTGAVESFRSANTSQAVPESGPADVRRLISAYNGMRTRIAGLLDEKDRMLGAIGHDLRTPLASLRVRAEGMDDDSERERMASTIEEMSQTLDDILSLARLGRPSEAETKVDLAALVDQVVEDFHALGANVSFEEAERITATVRPTLVARTLRNLIDNAIKYGDVVSVGIVRETDGVCITIDDQGPGIPEDRIEDMFEPFTRLEQSRSRETGGSGLGLALAKAIAQQHGGRLTLENRTQGGLRASLWLPAR